MTSSRVEQAARNNAVWCETVCRVHGTPGEFHDALWLNRHPVPRFYPNVVTLSTQDGTAAQLANIQALVATGLPGRWGVKDSFCLLDLAARGFQPLFEATWLWRAPFQPLPNRAASGLHWTWVQSAPELAKWEMAWSGSPANNHLPSNRVSFFQPCWPIRRLSSSLPTRIRNLWLGPSLITRTMWLACRMSLSHRMIRWRSGRAVSPWPRSVFQGCQWWVMSTGQNSLSLRRSALKYCNR